MCLSKCLPRLNNDFRRVLPSEQVSGPIRTHVQLKWHIGHLDTSTRFCCSSCCIDLLSCIMCPLRGSFKCLVRHVTASAMSTLSGATYAKFIAKLRYQLDPAGVSFSELSICPVCSAFLLTSGHRRLWHQPISCSSTRLQQPSCQQPKSSRHFARQS